MKSLSLLSNMSQNVPVLLFWVLVSNMYQDCLDESGSPLVQIEWISQSVTSFRLFHVWSRPDRGLLQPLLWHLRGHSGQRSGTGRRPESQPVCQDPHRGNLRQRHWPLRCHRSYSAGRRGRGEKRKAIEAMRHPNYGFDSATPNCFCFALRHRK